MPRPKTKEELLNASCENYSKLFSLIDSLTHEEQQKEFVFEDRDRNVRDVLVHLYEWQILLLNWVQSNQSGATAKFLPDNYNWKTYPDMNVKIWEKHQETDYEKATTLLNQTHKKCMDLIDSFTEEELFTKKYFQWTGSTSLGSYCVSSTSSHYDWAIKKLKKHKKLIRL